MRAESPKCSSRLWSQLAFPETAFHLHQATDPSEQESELEGLLANRQASRPSRVFRLALEKRNDDVRRKRSVRHGVGSEKWFKVTQL